MISAFGVDHGDEVSKADRTSTAERRKTHRALAGLWGGLDPSGITPAIHGAATAKKGKGWRAAANQGFGTAGGSFIGGTLGGLAGAGLGRGNAGAMKVGGAIGGVVGGARGSMHGADRNIERGYVRGVKPYKKKIKKNLNSFDLDEVSKAGGLAPAFAGGAKGYKARNAFATGRSAGVRARRATGTMLRNRNVQTGAAAAAAGGTGYGLGRRRND